eukprot:4130210-Pyramimonas_sp.AAC.1
MRLPNEYYDIIICTSGVTTLKPCDYHRTTNPIPCRTIVSPNEAMRLPCKSYTSSVGQPCGCHLETYHYHTTAIRLSYRSHAVTI